MLVNAVGASPGQAPAELFLRYIKTGKVICVKGNRLSWNKCEKACPQHLELRRLLEQDADVFEK